MSVSVRTCVAENELATSLEIYNRVWPQRAVTPDEVEAWKRAARASVEFLAAVDGVDCGSAAAALQPQRPDVCFALVTVLSEHRRRGAGSALYEAVSQWTADLHLDEIETDVPGDDGDSLAFATRRGFTERSRETGLELDVQGTPPLAFDPPRGIEIVTLLERPDLAADVYAVHVEAMPDIPGNEGWRPPPRKVWVETRLFGPRVPPDAVVLALADGEVAGYASLRLRADGKSATHGMTAVKRAWRGRGIASALKSAQIEWAREHGVETLDTLNELRNAPMRRVNERLGYRPAPGRVTMRGPLAPA